RFALLIFFFQAEDGIRDRNVTGVQTCALPISSEQLYPDLDPSGREALRHTYEELRAIRSGIVDDETRERLTAVEARLADILSGRSEERRVGKEGRCGRTPAQHRETDADVEGIR